VIGVLVGGGLLMLWGNAKGHRRLPAEADRALRRCQELCAQVEAAADTSNREIDRAAAKWAAELHNEAGATALAILTEHPAALARLLAIEHYAEHAARRYLRTFPTA
jgi:hypothetical protein